MVRIIPALRLHPAAELLTFLQSRSPLWPEGLSYDGEAIGAEPLVEVSPRK